MSAEMTGPHRTYGGWQQEKVAFLFGLSAPRAAMLAGAVLAAIAPVGLADLRAAVICWPAALAGAAAALIRVGGRTGDEWLAGLVSYLVIRARGQQRFAGGPFAPSQAASWEARQAGDAAGEAPALDLPGILAPLRILAVPSGGRDLAIVENRHDRTWTAVARVRFPGIGLADSARREARVAGWGALLASLCTEGTPLVRVQALQRLVPESGTAEPGRGRAGFPRCTDWPGARPSRRPAPPASPSPPGRCRESGRGRRPSTCGRDGSRLLHGRDRPTGPPGCGAGRGCPAGRGPAPRPRRPRLVWLPRKLPGTGRTGRRRTGAGRAPG